MVLEMVGCKVALDMGLEGVIFGGMVGDRDFSCCCLTLIVSTVVSTDCVVPVST